MNNRGLKFILSYLKEHKTKGLYQNKFDTIR